MDLEDDERLCNATDTFVIQDYSKMEGEVITIREFVVGGHSWEFYFCPFLSSLFVGEADQFVSVHIRMVDNREKEVKASVEINLVDQSGKGNHFSLKNSTPKAFKEGGMIWDFFRFYNRASLENSDFLKDDRLIFNVTIEVGVSSTSNSWLVYVPESDMGNYIGELLNNPIGCDVVFNVSGTIFHAHKVVLAARSSIFRDQFFEDDKAKRVDESEIAVSGVKPEVFKAMLHFIYTGTLLEDDMLIAFISSSELYDEALLAEAALYGLAGFRLSFYSYLRDNLSSDNVAKIFAIADHHNAMRLKSDCISFLFENHEAVIRYNGLKCLEEKFPFLHSEISQKVPGCEKKYKRSGIIQNPWSRFNIRYNLGVLLEDSVGSDVVFNVAGEKIHAHKVVLAARSSKFRTLFFENDKEKTVGKTEIGVSDVEPDVFKAMLHFIYKDALLVDSINLEQSSALDTFVVNLFVAARSCGLFRLELMCQSHLCKDLSTASVADKHGWAVRLHAKELETVCVQIVIENLADVLYENGLRYLEEQHPVLVSEYLDLEESMSLESEK